MVGRKHADGAKQELEGASEPHSVILDLISIEHSWAPAPGAMLFVSQFKSQTNKEVTCRVLPL
jgi:hypothetical protein